MYIHCINQANKVNDLRGPSEYQIYVNEKRDGIVRSLVQLGIPMFFYISGIATTFFNTEKHGFLVFLKSKVLRLLGPLVICIFVFLIPRHYLLQKIDDSSQLEAGKVEHNFFTYYGKIIPKIVGKLSWLWFLLGLFIDSLINYPLLKWT